MFSFGQTNSVGNNNQGIIRLYPGFTSSQLLGNYLLSLLTMAKVNVLIIGPGLVDVTHEAYAHVGLQYQTHRV
jgi:hypothetical protein